MGMGGSGNGMIAGLKAGTDNSPVYGMSKGMTGGAPTPGYTNAPISPNTYQPQYQQYQPQQRAPQYQQQMPNYQSGLQAAMMQMMQQYSRPMMRAPLQQGIAPSSPLNYRPPVVDNTSRVAPSVELQQKQAAEEAARLAAENPATPFNNYEGSAA